MNPNRKPRNEPELWTIIYDKGGKKIQNGGKTASSIIFVKLDSYMKKNRIGLLSHSIYKNPKLIKDENIRPATIKLLKENMDNVPFNIGLRNIFWKYLLR